MISYRIQWVLQLIFKLGCKTGAFCIQLEGETFILSQCKITKRKLIVNTILNYVWVCFCLHFSIVQVLQGDTNQMILTMLFTLFVVILSIFLSIPVFFSDDVVILLNRLFGFLRIIERKFIWKKLTYTCWIIWTINSKFLYIV